MPQSYDSTPRASLLDDNEGTVSEKRRRVCCCSAPTVALVLLLGFIILAIVDSFTTKYSEDLTNSTLDWIEANPAAGVFVYAVLYAVATVLFVPGSLLTLGAGYAFTAAVGGAEAGTALGSASVLLGASTGAVLSFLLGRFVFRSTVEKWVQRGRSEGGNMKYWSVLDSALSGEEGMKIMLLLRLSPLFPFNALNYLCGTTGISLRSYCISLLGIAPGTVLYVYLGAASADLATAGQGGSMARTVSLVMGACTGLAAVVWTSKRAKRELDRINVEDDGANDEAGEGGGEP